MNDLRLHVKLRIQLLAHNRMLCIFYGIIFVVFLFSLGGLLAARVDRSSVPVGLVDRDKSGKSDGLAARISGNPSFYVYQEEEGRAFDRLREGKTELLFLIENGYGQAVEDGRKKNLVSVYYLSGDTTNRILSDIVAGEMLTDICLADSYRLYSGQAADGVGRDEYYRKAELLLADDSLKLGFHYRYTGEEGETDYAGNQLIYGQAVLVLLLALLLLTAFLAAGNQVSDYGSAVALRRKTIPSNLVGAASGEVLSVYLVSAMTGLVFLTAALVVAGQKDAAAYGYGALYIIGFTGAAAAAFSGMAMLTRRRAWYEAAGSVLLVIFLIKIVSNGWFISKLTDILF